MSHIFMCGTCRLHETTPMVVQNGSSARSTKHRFHTPNQLLQLFQHINSEGFFSESKAYSVSDYAFEDIVINDIPPVETIEFLNGIKRHFQKSSKVIIEISSLREIYIENSDSRFYLNNFVKRDMEAHYEKYTALVEKGVIEHLDVGAAAITTLSFDKTIHTMRQLRKLLGNREVLWVTHANPENEDQSLENVKAVRTKVIEAVSAGANMLGDHFFDPSVIVKRLSDSVAWEKNGTDLHHYTKLMKESLAKIYASDFSKIPSMANAY